MTFTGFPAEGIRLLGELPTCDKAAFAAMQELRGRTLLEPAREFASAVGDRLAVEVSADIVTLPKIGGSVAPLHRDLRFDPGGPRYKDHLLFRWWEGSPRKTAPNLFVRIDPTTLGFACGTEFGTVAAWRKLVADPGMAHQLLALVEDVQRKAPGAEVAGRDLKRVPAPFPADHRGAALLRHKAMFQVRWALPMTDEIHRAEFVSAAMAQLTKLARMHQWLVRALQAT